MEDESKTQVQVFVIAVVLILLTLVMVSAISLAIKSNNDKNSIDVRFKQIYSSEMNLSFLGDDLFIHQLVKRYPNVKFIMILHKKYYNVFKSFNYNNIKRLIKYLY